MISDKERIGRSFSSAADSYSELAVFQKQSAEDFGKMLSKCAPFPSGPILEAGCGTGFVTEKILKYFPHGVLYSCDLSDGMLDFCRTRFQGENRFFFHHDFDDPFPLCNCGLAVSALSLQWSTDIETALRNLSTALADDGKIILSIPLDASLETLKILFRAEGMLFPGQTLPTREEMEKYFRAVFRPVEVLEKSYTEVWPDLKSLLDAMRKTGTGAGNKGTSPGFLRKLLRENARKSFTVQYSVLFLAGEKK